mgnify:FL=1|tara:strand:+ start:274 stop:855 length:582 start_codon:yes stop_codon:yes gene_type:complete
MIKENELPKLDKPLGDLTVIAYRTTLSWVALPKPLKFIIQLFAKFEHIEAYLDGKVAYSSAKTTQFIDIKEHWLEYLLPNTKVYVWEPVSETTDWQKEQAKKYINSRIGKGYNVSGAASSVMGGWVFKAFKAFLKFFGKDLDKKKEDYCSQTNTNIFVVSIMIDQPKDTQISPVELIKLVEASGNFKPRRRIK